MSTEHEDFSDSKPLTEETRSSGSKKFEELDKAQQERIMRSINNEFEDTSPYYNKHYRVKKHQSMVKKLVRGTCYRP